MCLCLVVPTGTALLEDKTLFIPLGYPEDLTIRPTTKHVLPQGGAGQGKGTKALLPSLLNAG